MSYNYLPLDRKWLNFQQVKNLLDYDQLVSITFDAHERILACREYLDKKLFDRDKNKEQVAQLQHNLVASNACGIGEEVPVDVVKLMLMLKIKSLSFGYSGVQIETVKRLMELYNKGAIPVVYTQGAGNTALSNLSVPIIGVGKVNFEGRKRSSAEVLKDLKLEVVALQSNEASALMNGTQFITAYGFYCLKKAEQLIKMADVIAALSFDAFDGDFKSMRHPNQSAHSFKGQADTAFALTNYLKGSEISNRQKQHGQTPFSFSVLPQVHGATKDAFEYVLNIFLKEINSVAGSANIFPGDDLIINSGNFGEQPLALALDFLCIAMSGLSTISERRIAQLVNSQSELQSSFINLQQTVAGVVTENRQLCTPASIHNFPFNNIEDYINNAGNAATKCLQLINNIEKVLAFELLIAAQTIEFKRPLKTSPSLEELLRAFKQQVLLKQDESILHEKINSAIAFVSKYQV